MYQLVSFGPYSCPASSSQYPTSPFTVSSGTIVSIGFQNSGFAKLLAASQMFVVSATQAFVQVTNSSLSSTTWYAWAVVDTGSSADVEIKPNSPEMKAEPIQDAK